MIFILISTLIIIIIIIIIIVVIVIITITIISLLKKTKILVVDIIVLEFVQELENICLRITWRSVLSRHAQVLCSDLLMN